MKIFSIEPKNAPDKYNFEFELQKKYFKIQNIKIIYIPSKYSFNGNYFNKFESIFDSYRKKIINDGDLYIDLDILINPNYLKKLNNLNNLFSIYEDFYEYNWNIFWDGQLRKLNKKYKLNHRYSSANFKIYKLNTLQNLFIEFRDKFYDFYKKSNIFEEYLFSIYIKKLKENEFINYNKNILNSYNSNLMYFINHYSTKIYEYYFYQFYKSKNISKEEFKYYINIIKQLRKIYEKS